MPEKHWKAIAPSRFPWEQEALDFVFQHFPAQDNYLAWSNFEFIADDGSINEVDLLVVCPQGAFLTEIKSRPGTVSGDQSIWTWDYEGKRHTEDNPVLLANRKCKRLKSLLAPACLSQQPSPLHRAVGVPVSLRRALPARGERREQRLPA